jgi:D-alanyl-lipoteichoic acid acyltransferase DltB (MBOAT superfamily)
VRWVHFYTAFSLRRSARAFQATLPALASLIIIGLWHEVQVTYLLWGVHHSAGILLGDAVGAAFALLAASRAAPLLTVARHVAGMAFVWAWVGLSHCFTLLSDPGIAFTVYCRALGFGR